MRISSPKNIAERVWAQLGEVSFEHHPEGVAEERWVYYDATG